MFQDAKGRVGNKNVLLTPPLVSVHSCHVFDAYNKPSVALDRTASSSILLQNAFDLCSIGAYTERDYKIVFVFHVTPPARLVGVHLYGTRKCVIKLDGGSETTKEVKTGEEGFFDLSKITTNKIQCITLTIPDYHPRTDDNQMSVCFKFAQAVADIVSVGSKLLKHEASMDCMLVTHGEGPVRFHRAVLAASSGYFDKLFYGDFAESKAETIDVKGKAVAWDNIKSMMYTSRLNPSAMGKEDLIDTLETLYLYDLEVFVPSVWEILLPMQDGAIAARSLRLAGLHHNTTMGLGAMAYIENNISALMCNCEWVKMYADVLLEIGDVPPEFITE